jgi:hypothetical protein
MMTRRKFTFTKLTPELAYVLGVFFGDGDVSVPHPYPKLQTFALDSIDREFVEKTKKCCESFLDGPLPDIRTRPPAKKYGKHEYYRFQFGSVEFCNWLDRVTKHKTRVPDFIPRTKCPETKAFCEGFLDSEGCISESKKVRRNGNHDYTSGFGNCGKFVFEIAKLFRLNGVQVSTGRPWKTKVGTPYYYFHINLRSFVQAGFGFVAKRKQERLERFKLRSFSPSETVHQAPKGEDTVQTAAKVAENNGNIIPPNII